MVKARISLEDMRALAFPNYTIPSNNRELRPDIMDKFSACDYTIPSNNRELRRAIQQGSNTSYYTIPSNNRELRLTSVNIT